eukprot:CAMPEP_0184644360 /NCGR_PEP_ID=MMETSP0308-20130426/1086_1 /TAXON_ID=38269 /ORGANISM="Gloeochaete witrockiana, Strain SAG 46.84" /LENGTH=67 /DNA_ID=CAMNT_0027072837 /DNA_START=789 /DNA_END=992 /DNA_ORIENTATION=+
MDKRSAKSETKVITGSESTAIDAFTRLLRAPIQKSTPSPSPKGDPTVSRFASTSHPSAHITDPFPHF